MPLDDGNGSLDLVDDVERVGVPRVREDDAHERAGEVVPVGGGPLEGVAVVEVWVGDVRDVAAKDDEACDADAIMDGDVSDSSRGDTRPESTWHWDGLTRSELSPSEHRRCL